MTAPTNPEHAYPIDEASCSGLLAQEIPASGIGLPTSGAHLTAAILVASEPPNASPEYCRVTGEIAPFDQTDLPIRFQLNLPSTWNGKAVQFGGAGSNGVVITGLGNANHAPTSALTPLQRGYATFGSDSGHATTDPDWVANERAYANFAGESVKRTYDVAAAYIAMYLGRRPDRTYFIGGSKGGHEGLVAAQRYGGDYDGVIAYYPARAAFAMQMSWGRMGYAAATSPQTALSVEQQGFVKQSVVDACDRLDGVSDGIISNVRACRASFSLESLACDLPESASTNCLTAPQIEGLAVAATPLVFDWTMPGNLKSIGPYPVLDGADFGAFQYNPLSDFLGSIYRNSGDDMARQITGRSDISWPDFDYRDYRAEVEELSAQYDASNSNLDSFAGHGGKLLLIQGTTDMLVPEDVTTQYWGQLISRYGVNLTGFARYYIQPGFGHGTGDFLMKLDSLTVLEKWVEGQEQPGQLLVFDANIDHRSRTRPLCEYPSWPRYKGQGDPNIADSFDCVTTSD